MDGGVAEPQPNKTFDAEDERKLRDRKKDRNSETEEPEKTKHEERFPEIPAFFQ